jgi:hypothetical protein
MAQIILNPRGVFRIDEHPIAARPDSLNNKVLGLIDNSKMNADVFLDFLLERIKQSYIIPEVLLIRKSISGTPAPCTDEFFKTCDIVVNAFGD